MEITLHFINIKELKFYYRQNRNKLARALVAISEKRCGGYRPLDSVTMRLEGLFIIEKQWKTINIQKPNPRR